MSVNNIMPGGCAQVGGGPISGDLSGTDLGTIAAAAGGLAQAAMNGNLGEAALAMAKEKAIAFAKQKATALLMQMFTVPPPEKPVLKPWEGFGIVSPPATMAAGSSSHSSHAPQPSSPGAASAGTPGALTHAKSEPTNSARDDSDLNGQMCESPPPAEEGGMCENPVATTAEPGALECSATNPDLDAEAREAFVQSVEDDAGRTDYAAGAYKDGNFGNKCSQYVHDKLEEHGLDQPDQYCGRIDRLTDEPSCGPTVQEIADGRMSDGTDLTDRFPKVDTPQRGDAILFPFGSSGSEGGTGHIGFVTSYNPATGSGTYIGAGPNEVHELPFNIDPASDPHGFGIPPQFVRPQRPAPKESNESGHL